MGNKCETGNVKRFFLLLLGSFLSLSAWAQTGVICGTVSDAKFKDALIGASVVIEGTTVGAIADVEGNFRISSTTFFVPIYLSNRENIRSSLLMSLINRKLFETSW